MIQNSINFKLENNKIKTYNSALLFCCEKNSQVKLCLESDKMLKL